MLCCGLISRARQHEKSLAEIFKILTLRRSHNRGCLRPDYGSCFEIVFLANSYLRTGVFYLKVRNFNYSRSSECCFFEPINCPFVLHMGCLLPTANLVKRS